MEIAHWRWSSATTTILGQLLPGPIVSTLDALGLITMTARDASAQ